MMMRLKKLGDVIFSTATYPIRFCIGAYKAIDKHMPESIELPIEIKVKEDKDGNTRSEAVSRGES